MSTLSQQLYQAQERWKATASPLIRHRWKKLLRTLNRDETLNSLDALGDMFGDAMCSWIGLDDDQQVVFANNPVPEDREMMVLSLVSTAVRCEYDHILHRLLSLGALDRLLLHNIESSLFLMGPAWLRERFIALLSSGHIVEDGIYSLRGTQVEVDPYEICIYPVTQVLYELISDKNPSMFYGLTRPVEMVSWFDAVEFCNSLSEYAQLEPAYKIHDHGAAWIRGSTGFRLPTELEWEIAASANLGSTYAGEDTWEQLAHCQQESIMAGTRRVAMGKSNSWGLFDMSGNVFEWCWDRFSRLPTEYPPNYRGKNSSPTRVRKGGGWNSRHQACEIKYRSDRRPSYACDNTGFRLVRTL